MEGDRQVTLAGDACRTSRQEADLEPCGTGCALNNRGQCGRYVPIQQVKPSRLGKIKHLLKQPSGAKPDCAQPVGVWSSQAAKAPSASVLRSQTLLCLGSGQGNKTVSADWDISKSLVTTERCSEIEFHPGRSQIITASRGRPWR